MKRVLAPLFVLTLADPAWAYRPFDGTDADVSGTSEIELEIGPVGYLRAQHDNAIVFGNTVFNYGLMPRWELVIQGVGLWGLDTPAPPRFTNGGIFVKHVLREGTLQDKTGLSLASEVGVLLPSPGDPVANDGGVYMGFIGSYAWKELIVHLNASLARSPDRAPDLFVGSIFEFHPKARARPVMEVFVDRHGDETIPSFLFGAIFQAMEHLSFDAATRVAWQDAAPLFEIRLGLTWTIPAHKRHPHFGPHVHDE